MKLSDWPSLRLVIPLIAGIYISDTIENTRAEMPVWCLIVTTLLTAIIALISSGRHPRISGFCLSLSFVLAGASSYAIQMNRVRVEWPPRYAVYKGLLNSYPLERERSYRLEVMLRDSLYRGHNIYLYLPKDSAAASLEPGTLIVFDGKVNKPSSEGAGFDYASYLLSHGISGTLRVQAKDWHSLPPDGTGGLRVRAVRFRRAVIRKYREWGLEGNSLAVVSAVSLGEKRALNDQLREVYSTSGVSHVLAVSGLHVGIMCWFLYLIFPAVLYRKAEWLRQLLVMGVLWAYAFAIGLPVSITRTLIMFSIVAICRALERETSALNSLGIAAMIMLAANPSALFDMSFQLSFSAVLFIVIITPIMLQIYEPSNPLGRYLWRVSVLSFAAQIGTVPIVMYHFSGFSTYVMLANLIVVPVMFVIVSLSMSLWIVGWFPFFRAVVVTSLTWLVDNMTGLLTRISALPYSHLELSLHRGWVVFVIYTVVILICLWYKEKRTHRLVQALCLHHGSHHFGTLSKLCGLNHIEYLCGAMIKNMLSGIDVAEFRIWMGWADRYVILTHMGPDGDAIGSSLALCRYLRSKGKEAVVIVPDSAPDFLSWLPGAEDLRVFTDDPDANEDLVYKADVLCCLDFNVVGRIGKIAASFLYSKAKKFLLDHHPFPGANYTVTLSHPEASSTSELVFHLICALGDFSLIDKEMAQCIYTGIMTDTGALSYNSNSSNLFQVVSHLLDKGVDKDEIYRLVYNNYSESRLRLQGFVLNEKMQVFPDKSTSLITLTDKELRKFKYRKGDTEGFVNMPLQINGVLMSAFFREDKEQGIIKLSFRSVGTVPCNRFSSDFFNGGGHQNAAGGEYRGTLEEAVERFHKGLDEWSHSQEDCIRQLFRQ